MYLKTLGSLIKRFGAKHLPSAIQHTSFTSKPPCQLSRICSPSAPWALASSSSPPQSLRQNCTLTRPVETLNQTDYKTTSSTPTHRTPTSVSRSVLLVFRSSTTVRVSCSAATIPKAVSNTQIATTGRATPRPSNCPAAASGARFIRLRIVPSKTANRVSGSSLRMHLQSVKTSQSPFPSTSISSLLALSPAILFSGIEKRLNRSLCSEHTA